MQAFEKTEQHQTITDVVNAPWYAIGGFVNRQERRVGDQWVALPARAAQPMLNIFLGFVDIQCAEMVNRGNALAQLFKL